MEYTPQIELKGKITYSQLTRINKSFFEPNIMGGGFCILEIYKFGSNEGNSHGIIPTYSRILAAHQLYIVGEGLCIK